MKPLLKYALQLYETMSFFPQVIAKSTEADQCKFYDFNGKEIPWWNNQDWTYRVQPFTDLHPGYRCNSSYQYCVFKSITIIMLDSIIVVVWSVYDHTVTYMYNM